MMWLNLVLWWDVSEGASGQRDTPPVQRPQGWLGSRGQSSRFPSGAKSPAGAGVVGSLRCQLPSGFAAEHVPVRERLCCSHQLPLHRDLLRRENIVPVNEKKPTNQKNHHQTKPEPSPAQRSAPCWSRGWNSAGTRPLRFPGGRSLLTPPPERLARPWWAAGRGRKERPIIGLKAFSCFLIRCWWPLGLVWGGLLRGAAFFLLHQVAAGKASMDTRC